MYSDLASHMLKYHILSPGGNTTAIVEQYYQDANLQLLSRFIMNRHKEVEQVGFLDRPKSDKAKFRLQMMGGEFCGNATRAIAYLKLKNQISPKAVIEVSGFDGLVEAEVGEAYSAVRLPGNFFISEFQNGDITIVELAGIRHLVAFAGKNSLSEERLIEEYRDENSPAVGVMYVERNNGRVKIDPYVWVRDMNTIVPETACGSGSIAVALAMRRLSVGIEAFQIEQPSGASLEVELISQSGNIQSIRLNGPVKYVEGNTILLDSMVAPVQNRREMSIN